MRTPLILLRAIGKAAMHCCGVGVFGELLTDALPEIANNVWDEWTREKNDAERRAELEAIIRTSNAELRLEIRQIVREEVAADTSEQLRRQLELYLLQVPASIRRTMRRPDDPTGQTLPPGLALKKADDLLPLLPARLPRFRPGDRPLPGVDWELVELLGIGGFGEVWKARHTSIEDFTPVALKFCIDPLARERLLRHEARLCGRVIAQGHHPGIVRLQQTYLSADPPCLQYEYVEGGDLAGLIREWHRQEEKPTPEQVARLILRLSEIVAFAHRLDPPIVHRDLKPANILVQHRDGESTFKIADFGIGGVATAQAIEATGRDTGRGLHLTTAVRGAYTPLYASPEQMHGGPPDPRDDVYALGVIWYQMMTGNLAEGSPTGSQWRRQLIGRGMSPPLIALLESCFEAAEDRPPDAAALAGKIAGALKPSLPTAAETLSPEPTGNSSEKPKLAELLRAAKHAPRANSARELHRLEGHKGPVTNLFFTCDGNYLLSASKGEGTAILWDAHNYEELARYKFASNNSLYNGKVVLSPTGDRLLILRLERGSGSWGSAKIVGLGDRAAIRQNFLDREDIACAAFSTDGSLLLTGHGYPNGGVRLWDMETGEELVSRNHEGQTVVHVAFFPDNRRILVAVGMYVLCYELQGCALVPQLGFSDEEIQNGFNFDIRCAFSPDGSRAIFTGSPSSRHQMSLYDMRTFRKLCRFEGPATDRIVDVVISRNGRQALSGGDCTAQLWDAMVQIPPEQSKPEAKKWRLSNWFGNEKKTVIVQRELCSFGYNDKESEFILCVCFSPDGRFALTGTRSAIGIWEIPEIG